MDQEEIDKINKEINEEYYWVLFDNGGNGIGLRTLPASCLTEDKKDVSKRGRDFIKSVFRRHHGRVIGVVKEFY